MANLPAKGLSESDDCAWIALFGSYSMWLRRRCAASEDDAKAHRGVAEIGRPRPAAGAAELRAISSGPRTAAHELFIRALRMRAERPFGDVAAEIEQAVSLRTVNADGRGTGVLVAKARDVMLKCCQQERPQFPASRLRRSQRVSFYEKREETLRKILRILRRISEPPGKCIKRRPIIAAQIRQRSWCLRMRRLCGTRQSPTANS